MLNFLSQLLELLLDINGYKDLPPSLQVDLRSPSPSASNVPALSPDRETPGEDNEEKEQALAALDEARLEFTSGQIDLPAYKEIESSLAVIIQPPPTFPQLSKTSHSTIHGDKALTLEDLPSELGKDRPLDYLTAEQEDEYTATADSYILAHLEDDGDQVQAPIPPPPPKPTDRERERDAQLHNPMSVYNWLLKHRHDLGLDQGDDQQGQQPTSATSSTEKPTSSSKFINANSDSANNSANHHRDSNHHRRSSPKGSSAPTRSTDRKRNSTTGSAAAKQEVTWEEVLDDEGYVVEGTGFSGGFDGASGGGAGAGAGAGGSSRKRKSRGGGKDDDDAYRPKGGSSRPGKRKRASTGA